MDLGKTKIVLACCAHEHVQITQSCHVKLWASSSSSSHFFQKLKNRKHE